MVLFSPSDTFLGEVQWRGNSNPGRAGAVFRSLCKRGPQFHFSAPSHAFPLGELSYYLTKMGWPDSLRWVSTWALQSQPTKSAARPPALPPTSCVTLAIFLNGCELGFSHLYVTLGSLYYLRSWVVGRLGCGAYQMLTFVVVLPTIVKESPVLAREEARLKEIRWDKGWFLVWVVDPTLFSLTLLSSPCPPFKKVKPSVAKCWQIHHC